jgi:hypothetical protein
VKLVIMIRIAGASDSTVSRTMICIADEKVSFLLRSGRFRVGESGLVGLDSVGNSGTFCWARAGVGTRSNRSSKAETSEEAQREPALPTEACGGCEGIIAVLPMV